MNRQTSKANIFNFIGNKMNTAQDRANRISSWSTRGRDLPWIMTILIIAHLVMITLIGFELRDAFIPASVYLVFMTIMGILGSLDAMDDIAVQADDADEEEKQTNAWKRFNETQWGGFKGLIIAWFSLIAIAKIYVMWFVLI